MKAPRVAPGESRRELILDAADRLLAHFGYKKMTVEDIAKEAGIGKGTVYLHFASKEEVVLSHVDRIVRPLFAELDTIAAQNRSAADRAGVVQGLEAVGGAQEAALARQVAQPGSSA